MELEHLFEDAWVTDELGKNVRSADLVDEITAGIVEEAFRALREAIVNDPRKSFGKRAILDILEGVSV